MTIKSILCVFGGGRGEWGAVGTAFALGALHQAHIRFLHISSDPRAYPTPEDLTGYLGIIERLEEEYAARRDSARKYIASVAAERHVPLDDADIPRHHASAQFIHQVGEAEDIVAQEGRFSDLILISREISLGYTPEEPAILASLFGTGRPLLLLPAMEPSAAVAWHDQTIVLAWDGSLEAARATYHALPYLERSEKLYILQVRQHPGPEDAALSLSLTDYLRTHGIRKTEAISLRGENLSTGMALLNKAKELKADLLVMGAYGHNRYREMLLGGVTNDLLEKSDIPLLLSH